MKIRYLMIIGLLLAIMTVGAASASDDIDCNLTVENAASEPIEVSDDAVLEDSNDDVLGYNKDGLYFEITESENTNDFNNEFDVVSGNVNHYCGYAGKTLDIYVDNDLKTSTRLPDEGGHFSVKNKELNITDYGVYKIDVKYGNNLLESKILNVSYDFKVIASSTSFFADYLEYGDIILFKFTLPKDATGKLTFTLNGNT